MGATSKGNAFEREAEKILKADGWSVFRQHRKPIFIKGKMIMVGCDIFGCDIVAKKESLKTLWIQVATRANKATKIKQVAAHPWSLEHETLQLWLRTAGCREFEIYQAPNFTSVGVVKVSKK